MRAAQGSLDAASTPLSFEAKLVLARQASFPLPLPSPPFSALTLGYAPMPSRANPTAPLPGRCQPLFPLFCDFPSPTLHQTYAAIALACRLDRDLCMCSCSALGAPVR